MKEYAKGDGKFGTLSHEKLMDVVDQQHPRRNDEPISLMIPMGSFGMCRGKTVQGVDELGIGVTLYFKLLKSMGIFFFVCFLLHVPLIVVYSTGKLNQ